MHRPATHARRLGLALLLAAVVSGCGTTVVTGPSAGGAPTSDGLGPVTGEPVTGSTAGAPTTGDAPPVTSTTPAGVDPSAGEGTSAPSNPTGTRPGATATRTAKPVLVGVEYSSDYEETMSSLGFSGLATGDIPALVTTLVADLNARGGVAGRPVRAALHNSSTAAKQSDPQGATQATCAAFLEDTRVDVVLTPSAIFTDCFVQARVVALQTGTVSPFNADRAHLAPRAPYLFAPTSFETERLYPLYVARLAAQGYFPREARVGLLSSNQPSLQRQATQLLALLRQRGITVAATFEYDASSAGSIASGVSASVLRFRSEGVTHVISLDGNVGVFMIQAEQQGYRPRYAMNTFMGPSSVQVVVAPAAQLRGAVGVGWSPTSDVDPAADDHRSAGRTACDAAIRRSGQDLSSSRSATFIAYSICESFSVLVEGARRTGRVDAAGLREGLAGLGTRFPSPMNLESAYSADRSAGASAVRDLHYVEECSCFRYASTTVHR